MVIPCVMRSPWRRHSSFLRTVVTVATGVLISTGAAGAQQSHFEVLHTFTGGADRAYPFGSVIQATDGNFYGTTLYGGAPGLGTVFKLTPSGTVTVLHAFKGGTDGVYPTSLILG